MLLTCKPSTTKQHLLFWYSKVIKIKGTTHG